jgi:hypothetical protein
MDSGSVLAMSPAYYDLEGQPARVMEPYRPQVFNGRDWVAVDPGRVLHEGRRIPQEEFDALVLEWASHEAGPVS